MCFIYAYTILDEYLSEVFKILGMYLDDFLSNANVKISYSQYKAFKNETDLREYFIDTAIIADKNISGALSKAKYLLKYLKVEKEYSLTELGIFNEERNCVIHNNSIYNSKALNNMNKLSENLAKNTGIALGKRVKLNNQKVDSYITLGEKIISFLTNTILREFGEFYEEIDLGGKDLYKMD